MNIEFVLRNCVANDATKAVIAKKLDRFDKYFKGEADALVKMERLNDMHFMEISLTRGKMRIRAEVQSNNMSGNIDVIMPKLERQVVKYRDKLTDKYKKSDAGAPGGDNAAPPKEPAEDRERSKIVKVKRFSTPVTSLSNAIDEMEMLDHSFYVFHNAESDRICVLYRRHDGNLGLIEPEC